MVVFVSIHFLSQVKRTEPALVASLNGDLFSLVRERSGIVEREEEPFLFSFDDSTSACRLQTVETALECAKRLERDDAMLHGWSVFIGNSTGDVSADLARCKSAWRLFPEDRRVYVSKDLASSLSRHLILEPTARDPVARQRAYEQEEANGGDREGILRRLEDSLRRPVSAFLRSGSTSLSVTGPEHSGKKESLLALFADDPGALVARGEWNDDNPFASLLSAVRPSTIALAGKLFNEEEESFWKSLLPAFERVRSEGFRRTFPRHVESGFRLFFAAYLELYRRSRLEEGKPPVVLCLDVHCWSTQAQDLLEAMLGMKNGRDGCKFVLVCAGKLPRPLAEATEPGFESSLPDRAEILDWFEACGIEPPRRVPIRADALECRWNAELARFSPGGTWMDREEAGAALLSSLPPEASTYVRIASLSRRTLKPAQLERFLSLRGFSPALLEMTRAMLVSRGLVSSAWPYAPVTPGLDSRAAANLGDDDTALRALFDRHVAEMLASRELVPGVDLWERARGDLGTREHELLLDAISAEIAIDNAAALARGANRDSASGIEAARCWQIGAFENALAMNDRDECVRTLDALKGLKGSGSTVPAGIVTLCKASFACAAGDPATCQSLAKSAVMDLHGKKAFRGEARAHRLLGLSSLATGRLFDAMDYFANGHDVARGAKEAFEELLCAFSCAVAHFVYGNLSRAIRWFDTAHDRAIDLHRKDWEGMTVFGKARARFEVGQYEAAMEELTRLDRLCSMYGDPDFERLSSVWRARALVHSGRPDKARAALESRPDDAEALYFLAEERFLAGDPMEAARLSERALGRASFIRFFSPDTPHRESGYRSFEQRGIGTLSGVSFETDVMRAFGSFVASYVDHHRDYAREIHDMTREDRIAAVHPCYHQYCFYSYLIVDSGSESSLDKLTALSKAFKALQQRATRNDETSMKNSYLENCLWNRRIVEAAKEHKFV